MDNRAFCPAGNLNILGFSVGSPIGADDRELYFFDPTRIKRDIPIDRQGIVFLIGCSGAISPGIPTAEDIADP